MSILDFSRLFSDVHSPFRVSINPSIREEKTDSTNNQRFKNLQNIKKWNPLKAQTERVSNVFFAAEINKWHKYEVQVLMKSWFISSGLILLSFSERSLKLLTFMYSMNTWAFNGFHSAAKNTFETRSVYKGKPKIVKGDKPWFNLDCEFARQNYRKLKRKKKLYPWQITPKEVNNAVKHYKKNFRQQSEKTP
jgi:hypothetical protein